MKLPFIDKLLGLDEPVWLHYDDIPDKPNLSLESTSYPQRLLTTLELRPLSFFRDRYAKELKFSLPALQLPNDELDRLVMPTVTRCIGMMHLLPASESHHHSGAGGLLVHSLQCATSMVNAVKLSARTELNKDQTHKQIYHNGPRWLLAAFLTGLLHDVGKVYDMEVCSDKRERWDPDEGTLLDWGYRLRLKRYHVRWKPDRTPNGHTVKSIRLMHARLLERDCLRYLRACTGDLIVEAMDYAIDKNTGPLAEFLREAETVSIEKDAIDRRQLGLSHTRAVQSVFSCVLAALQKLVGENGKWQIGSPECPIVFLPDAVYLRLTKESLQKIAETTAAMGAGPIPVDTGGMVRVLSDAGFLLQNRADQPPSWLWQIPAKGHSGKKGNDNPFDAVRLSQPALLFPNGLPQSAGRSGSALVCLAPRSDETKTHRPTVSQAPKPEQTEPPKEPDAPSTPQPPSETSYIAPSAPSYSNDSGEAEKQTKEAYLTRDMCFSERATPAETKQALEFTRRLLITLAAQAHLGRGFLLEGGTLEGTQFSTVLLEDVLRRQKVDFKTAEFVMRSLETRPALEIDLKNHVARLRINVRN